MDLVGIMHVVDMPLAGKRDFNYLCSWFDIVHSDPLGISSVWYSSVHINFLPLHNSNVHPMSLIGPCYGSSLLFQELWLSYLCGGCFLQTKIQCSCFCRWYCMVYAVVMHSVDMGKFCFPLCSIIWCRLLDHPAAQTLYT